MDIFGKSGVICNVFVDISLFGMQVEVFKVLSKIEFVYDYLWCIYEVVLCKGWIGVFDCLYYEDVLVVKVCKFVFVDMIEQCYDQINVFEKYFIENGVMIFKFMLNVGYEE